MAPSINVEDQNRFLIACIKNSNQGKVDFEKVAQECNIVTKAAAAKRYERILKAQHESSTNAPTSGVPSTPPKTPPSKNGISKPTRKRATKTSISAKMKKRLEEEGRLNNENILNAKKKPDKLPPGDDGKIQLNSQG